MIEILKDGKPMNEKDLGQLITWAVDFAMGVDTTKIAELYQAGFDVNQIAKIGGIPEVIVRNCISKLNK